MSKSKSNEVFCHQHLPEVLCSLLLWWCNHERQGCWSCIGTYMLSSHHKSLAINISSATIHIPKCSTKQKWEPMPHCNICTPPSNSEASLLSNLLTASNGICPVENSLLDSIEVCATSVTEQSPSFLMCIRNLCLTFSLGKCFRNSFF